MSTLKPRNLTRAHINLNCHCKHKIPERIFSLIVPTKNIKNKSDLNIKSNASIRRKNEENSVTYSVAIFHMCDN